MTFEKNEVRTGFLVLLTLGVLVAAVLLLGAPGLFKKQKELSIFFDNAAGVKPGAQVLLAGRKVGNVTKIETPVAKVLRPTKNPDYEVRLLVRVDRDAKIYRDAVANMHGLGLLGESVVDFVGGNEDSAAGDKNIAENGYTFTGTRAPDFSETLPRIIRTLEPVTSTATLTLDDLRKTIASLNVFFDRQGELQGALSQIKQVGANFSQLTSKEGSVTQTMQNLSALTGGLNDKNGNLQSALANLNRTTAALNKDNNLEKILQNFERASVRLETTTKQANALVAAITPQFTASATNFQQMTDTLKREPWRLVWKGSVKDYPAATTTVATIPASQGGPATLVTRQRTGVAATTVSRANHANAAVADEDLRAPSPKKRRAR